jgi:hypothetical protein
VSGTIACRVYLLAQVAPETQADEVVVLAEPLLPVVSSSRLAVPVKSTMSVISSLVKTRSLHWRCEAGDGRNRDRFRP